MSASRYKKLPKDSWKNSAALVADLNDHGFQAEIPQKYTEHLSQNWSGLQSFKSSSLGPELSSLAFTKKKMPPDLQQQWGLLLSEKDLVLENSLQVKNVEAAADFMLRKMIHEDWAGESAPVPEGVLAEVGVCIGPDCVIEKGVILEAGVRLGARVFIGAGTRIGANSRIGDDVKIGKNCRFYGPVAIAGDGFGLVVYPQDPLPRQKAHAGTVCIGDGVRLGSFVSIDRGVLEDTVIGSRSHLDNIIQIGHNSKTGTATVMCSFVGLAGSTIVGDYVSFGGLVVTKGHLSIGDHSQIGAYTAIPKSLAAHSQVRGYPPKPILRDLKIQSIIGKLPELYKTIREMEKKLNG